LRRRFPRRSGVEHGTVNRRGSDVFWTDESDAIEEIGVPDDVVDLAFSITCPTLPVDHACALSTRLREVLPWFDEEALAGVHLIHGAASGNGWYRPPDTADAVLHLSRRARMRLRLPRHRLKDARVLSGKTLDINGHTLVAGGSEVHRFHALPTLFSRYVITREQVDEERFLEQALRGLEALNVECRKLLCGVTHRLNFPEGPVLTRSLMVAELAPEHSIRLQQLGLGEGRKIGCGLFIPHKGIAPVKRAGG
jgi:CRISPR-associated protein Cas6